MAGRVSPTTAKTNDASPAAPLEEPPPLVVPPGPPLPLAPPPPELPDGAPAPGPVAGGSAGVSWPPHASAARTRNESSVVVRTRTSRPGMSGPCGNDHEFGYAARRAAPRS